MKLTRVVSGRLRAGQFAEIWVDFSASLIVLCRRVGCETLCAGCGVEGQSCSICLHLPVGLILRGIIRQPVFRSGISVCSVCVLLRDIWKGCAQN